MTVSTLRPSSTSVNDGTLTGGATAHAVLSDNSDSSYVTLDAGDNLQVGLDDLTLPANALINRIAVRLRTAYTSDTYNATVIVDIDPADASATLWTIWASPTTVVALSSVAARTDAAVDAASLRIEGDLNENGLRIYEAYVDVYLVPKPTLSVTDPTGTLTTDNAPPVAWTQAGLDPDGGDQTFYEVRIFSAAQYGAGGFSAGSSAATVESGILAGNAASWDMSDIAALLPNATYKAYVRIGQTVNGVVHWSNYTAGSAFTINVPVPATPTLALTDQGTADQRQRIVATDPGGGAVTTEYFQIQRSDDGGTIYADIRTLLGGGLVAISGSSATAYDYEAENGASVKYRARAIHGTTQFSDWSTVATGSWTSTKQGIKHPYVPSLNVECTFTSQPGHRRPARQGVFQPLGATRPVVISDSRGSDQGELVVMIAEADLDTFEALIEDNVPVLIQAPATHKWDDRWVSIGDVDFSRFADKSWVEEGSVSLPWVEVDRPDGDLVSWT